MALVPSAQYPSQTDADPAYPQGKARNAGAFQDGTGTPLEKSWLNDTWGFQQALLAEAGITPSGTPDQVGASDYLEAVAFVAERAAAAATKLLLASQALKAWTVVSSSAGGGSRIGAARDPSRACALVSNGAASSTFRVRGDGKPTVAGNVASPLGDIARDPNTNTYVAAVGGTSFAYRSTNFGTSWTIATTKPAGAADLVVWGDGTFLAARDDFSVYTSPTGDVWTLRLTGITARSICATRDAVGVEYLLAASQIAVVVSSDSGVNWAAGGVLPDAASHNVTTATGMASAPVGNQLLPFYLANISGGTAYRVYRASADGTGWAQISSLPMPPDLVGDNAQVKLLSDHDTGALLAVLQTNGLTKGTWLFLSIDGGLSWFAGVNVDSSKSAVAMANGRVFIGSPTVGGLLMSCYESELLG